MALWLVRMGGHGEREELALEIVEGATIQPKPPAGAL